MHHQVPLPVCVCVRARRMHARQVNIVKVFPGAGEHRKPESAIDSVLLH